jgi:hypothetical protein
VTTLAVRPSGVGPSTERGDIVSAGDFGMIGGISLGTSNSRGASDNMASC